MKKRIAVAFTGPSNSGKTTLIEKISKILIKDFKVIIIKNDPKDKAQFDIEGKDSYKFFQTGADVVVTSPTRTTLFSHSNKELDNIISILDDFDYLLVEGLKTLPLPRIAIFRNKLDDNYYECSDILAIDDSIELSVIPDGMSTLDLNNPQKIIEWIETNGKRV